MCIGLVIDTGLTSLHLVATILPVRVQGLQRSFIHSRFRFRAITPFHSIHLSLKIFCVPSPQVYRNLPLGLFLCTLACQAIFGQLPSPILTTCPNHLSCANSLISLLGNIPNPILFFRFLILSILVFPAIFLKYFISVTFN